MFTSSKHEYETLVNHGWQQEGTDCETPKTSSIGVYRLYNPALGGMMKMSHHYTSDKGEADNLVANWGWQYDNEGEPIFYSAQDSSGSALSDALAVHRLYNGGLSAHHFTLTQDEKTNLETNWGWAYENIGFYAYGHNWNEKSTIEQIPIYEKKDVIICLVCGEENPTTEHMYNHAITVGRDGWTVKEKLSIVGYNTKQTSVTSCTGCGETK